MTAPRDPKDESVIHATLAAADYARVATSIQARTRGPWRAVLGVAPALAAVAAAAAALLAARALGMPDAGAVTAAVGFGLLGAHLAEAAGRRWQMARQVQPGGAFLRPYTIEADEDGLTVRSEVSATRLVWEAVLAIDSDGRFVLFYLDAANALVAPRAAFSSEAAMKRFYERVTRMRAEALAHAVQPTRQAAE